MTTVTGYDYNPMTQTFDLPNERWEEYIKVTFLLFNLLEWVYKRFYNI